MRNIHIPTLAASTVCFTKILVILLVNFSSLINIAYIITINILLLLSLFVSYHTNLLIVKRVWVCSFLFSMRIFMQHLHHTSDGTRVNCVLVTQDWWQYLLGTWRTIYTRVFFKVRLFYLRDRLSAVKIQEI